MITYQGSGPYCYTHSLAMVAGAGKSRRPP